MKQSRPNSPRRIAQARYGAAWLMAMSVASGCTQAPTDANGATPGATEGLDPGSSVDNATAEDEDGGVSAPEPNAPIAPPDSAASCEDDAQRAADVLAQRCSGCHANGQRSGGFGEALDLEAIVARGLVVLGDLPGSAIYRVTVNGQMPLNASDLTVEEQRALADWILCKPDLNVTPVDGGAGPLDPGDGNPTPPDGDDADDADDLDDDDADDADDAIDEAADRDEDADEDADEAIEEAADDD